MTKTEYLNQAYYLDKQIKRDTTHIETLRVLADSVPSPSFGEHIGGSRSFEAPFVRTLERIWEKEAELQRSLNKLFDLKDEIGKVIDTLENKDEALVLTYRYLFFFKMEDIAAEMHISMSSVKRWHRSAIKNLIIPEELLKNS